MKNTTEIHVTKPIKWYNKLLQIDYKKLFVAMTKSALMHLKGDDWNAAKEGVGILNAIKLKNEIGGLAYLLILKSMINSCHDLFVENQFRLSNRISDLEKLYDDKKYLEFLDNIDDLLNDKELTINRRTITQPRTLSILPTLCEYFKRWIMFFGLHENEAESLSNRLPAYFVLAFNDEWRKNKATYKELNEILDTPATNAANEELDWLHYNAFLQKQVDQSVFDEHFSLRQIYIPLRASTYKKEKIKETYGNKRERTIKKEIVVDLKEKLDQWIHTSKIQECIKVITGGPGAGKSTFVKMWCASLAERNVIRVLFIPLHFFDLYGDLIDSIGKFINRNADISISYNPLERNEKILLVFDGLDELSQQGVYANTVAQKFIRFIERQNTYCNRDDNIRALFLITSREIIIQNNSTEFREPGQILSLLPYYISDQRRKYKFPELKEDQRDLWWNKYGILSGRNYKSLPAELRNERLDEISAQPLLNYLLALSVKRGKIKFSHSTNLNEIYIDLIEGVHERAYEGGRKYKSIENLEFEDFKRILQEIALAAWHGGDVRTTTIGKIEKHIKQSGLEPLLRRFKEDAKSGITRLLTAFYFREFGIEGGEPTFEFTHKSFGEFLTASRLVDFLSMIDQQVRQRKDDYNIGWDESNALMKWIIVAGETPIDDYLFSYIKNEIKRYPIDVIQNWQETIKELIEFLLKNGLPIIKLNGSITENIRILRNAEEALLALHYSCGLFTQTVSKIKFASKTNFGEWISKFQPQRSDNINVFAFSCLGFIDCHNQILLNCDLAGSNLQHSIFGGTDMQYTNLANCNLNNANFEKTNLFFSNLVNSDLEHANLKGASLKKANLRGANLKKADLKNANLMECNLSKSSFEEAILEEVNLGKTNLNRTNLKNANAIRAQFGGAFLKGADLSSIDLQNAKLLGTLLHKCKLHYANLENANLTAASILGCNLRSANLRGRIYISVI